MGNLNYDKDGHVTLVICKHMVHAHRLTQASLSIPSMFITMKNLSLTLQSPIKEILKEREQKNEEISELK